MPFHKSLTRPRLGSLRLIALAALLCVLSAGCGRYVNHKAEDAVNRILPDAIGPADSYETHVDGATTSILRGHIRHVTINGRGVRLDPTLTADTLVLDLTDVDVDTKSKTLRSVGSAHFTAGFGDTNLNNYVHSQKPDIHDLRVRLGERGSSDVIVTARPELLGIATLTVSITGSVTQRPPDGNFLDFTPSETKISILPIPRPLVNLFIKKLNPIVNLSTLRVPVRVRQIQVGQEALFLNGDIDPIELVRIAARKRS